MRKLKTVLIFFVCGIAAGSGFAALVNSPRLVRFWFIKGDIFQIPTYRYYAGVGVFLLFSFAAAYLISSMAGLLREHRPFLRKTVSAAIVASAPVMIFAIASAIERLTATPEVNSAGTIQLINIDPITLYLGGILAFVLLISVACWILTAKLYYPGVLLNFLMLPLALVLLYVAAKILDVPGEWSELITYPVLFSLLSASCGFWIAANQHANAS